MIYYIVPRKSQWIVLLIFSYLYYIAGGPRYVVFILFSTLVTWLMALLIEKAEGKENHKGARKLLILGLILNFWYAWNRQVHQLCSRKYQCIAAFESERDTAIVSPWNFLLYIPVLRLSS